MTAPPRRRRRRRSRLLGVALLVVLLEAALQLAGPLVQRAMSRPEVVPPADAAFRVLCVGDSNTFGLHLPRLYAYPSILQSALQARFDGPVSVVNRGIPGQNSAQVARGLGTDLADVDPDLVLVLAGINDTWNTDAEGGDLWGRLKLVRLARVLLAGVTTARPFEIRTDDAGEFVVDRGDGEQRVNVGESAGGARSGAALRAAVRRGLTRAVETCREHGATPVLMTYAEHQGDFAVVADVARELAAELEVTLVDHQRAFREHFAERGYETLMFSDYHPNQAGYRLMALGVDAALEQAGLVPARRAEAAGTARETPQRAPELSRFGDDKLALGGPPGWSYQLLLGGAAEASAGFEVDGLRVPLAGDAVLSLSRLEPSFSGRFDADGRAPAVRIPPVLRVDARRACLLVLHEPDPWDESAPAVAAVSAVVELPAAP